MIAKWKTPILGALLLVSVRLVGEESINLKLTIQKVVKTEAAWSFHILIVNLGPSSVYIEEENAGTRDLYGITIEQGTAMRQGWKAVGPHRDTPPDAVFELKPQEKIARVVTIPNPGTQLRSKNQHKPLFAGYFRATTRYFTSAKEWSEFIHDPKRKAPSTVSKVIHLADGPQ